MPGHLFVVRGDLTRIACDAWLLPTGRSLQIRSHWLKDAPLALKARGRVREGHEAVWHSGEPTPEFRGVLSVPPGWNDRTIRSFEISESDWPAAPGQPRPWPTQIVVGRSATPAEKSAWCTEGARAFVEAAAAKLAPMKPANGRHRPLLALPVVGTGDGGGWAVAGEIVKRLVSVLLDVVQTVNADVVIVTRTDDQFAAVQQARRTIQRERHIDPWPALSGRVRDEGDRLAAFARDGQLVLFLGAGVSVGAGLPTWNGLLDRLATRAELTDDERTALRNLPVLDQAHIIRDRLERGPNGERHDGALADAIVAETTQEHYGLAHALLASLPIRESVTTNYDTLFEGASGAAGYKTATLPYESTAGAARWLLKMHGCVKRPQDIVLTREDFLRYVNQRSALAGIVQALLITRHMLFVGFSLTDDNFLRIADEVRRVVRLPRPGASSAPPAPFGTALLLSHSQLLPSLWTGDITCVSMTEAPVASDATDDEKHAVNAKAANDLEILLDYILAASSQNSAHLLDERYKALLSEDERALRQMLKELVHSADRQTGVRTLPAWKPIEALLQALGGAGKP